MHNTGCFAVTLHTRSIINVTKWFIFCFQLKSKLHHKMFVNVVIPCALFALAGLGLVVYIELLRSERRVCKEIKFIFMINIIQHHRRPSKVIYYWHIAIDTILLSNNIIIVRYHNVSDIFCFLHMFPSSKKFIIINNLLVERNIRWCL